MTHDQLQELLGVYALDALEPEERQAVEEHLVGCPRCREELQAHLETAALLGSSLLDEPAQAPAALWERVAAELQEEPPAPAPFPGVHNRRLLGLVAPLGAVAAALIVVVALLAAKVGSLDGQVGKLSQQGSVASVLLDPSHRSVLLGATGGAGWQATVIFLREGDGYDGYLVNPDMPALPRSETFQLWAISSGKVVSLGVLGAHPSGAPLRIEPGMTALMITAEPLGGTPGPTTPVLVRGALSLA